MLCCAVLCCAVVRYEDRSVNVCKVGLEARTLHGSWCLDASSTTTTFLEGLAGEDERIDGV